MLKIVLAMLVGAGCLFSNDLTVTPIIKAEFIGIQMIDTNVSAGSVIFGDNSFGVTATKGDIEVVGVVSLVDVPEFGVDINKVYISKKFNESLKLNVGYKDLPYGFWYSNCVNLPLVRTGNFDPTYESYVIKTKAPQIGITWKQGVVETDVVGYMHGGKYNSAVAKSEVNLGDVIAVNMSVKVQNVDTLSLAAGGSANMGKFQLSGVYSRSITENLTGSYVEFAVFPTDINVTALRADLLIDSLSNGISSYSLSTVFFLTENFYIGSEYTLQSNIVNTKSEKPTHMVTGLIGVEF